MPGFFYALALMKVAINNGSMKLQAFFAKKIRFLVNVIRNLLATNQKHKT
jgi:hypothetical protein